MKKILVIDDEPSITMILKEFLTDEGYEVYALDNGDSALEKLNSGIIFDLIIVDLKIPGTSGKTLIKSIREHPKLSEIPVIIITGFEKTSDDFPAEDTYQALFTKPFMLEEVLDEINRLLSP